MCLACGVHSGESHTRRGQATMDAGDDMTYSIGVAMPGSIIEVVL